MTRRFALLAALVFSTGVNAQALTGTSQQVSLLAPQLVQFAGSQANFDAIVTGLTQGIPVTITTTDAAGTVQIVTFTPPSTLAAADAARVVEAARNTLITRGVATPSAQQIATALVGGSLTTPAGTSAVTGAIPGATGTTLIQVRNEVTAVPTTATAATGTVNATNLQALRANLAQTGLSQFETNQALQLAGVILAQNGIVNPTIDQLQIALAGGNLLLPTGALVPIQGVLQGRIPAAAATGATASVGAGFPTAGGNSVQIPTPTAPTAGTPQFGNSITPANNAAASGATVSPATAGFRGTR